MPEQVAAGNAIRSAANHVTVVSTGELGAAVHRRVRRLRRARAVRRTTLTTLGAIAVFGLVVGGIILHHGLGPEEVHAGAGLGTSGSTAASRTTTTLTPAFPPQPPVTSVPGYTAAQATTTLSRCLAVAASPDPSRGAVLRAAVDDSAGSTLVITTKSGWQTCNVLPSGAAAQVGSMGFDTWAGGDGWSLGEGSRLTPAQRLAQQVKDLENLDKARAPTDAPDYYLTTPVEVLSDGGGLVGAPSSAWRALVIGRAAPDISRVEVAMPSGVIVSAKVQNGIFIADQLTSISPGYGPNKPDTVWGYDSAGQLVYQSPTPTLAASCYLTPAGQAVTPPVSGQACKTAVPWG